MKHNWEYKKLGEVCEIYQPKTISTSQLLEDGLYPVFGANGIIGRYSNYNHEFPEILLTCRGATCGTINISEPKSWINGNAMVIHSKSKSLKFSFLKYVMNSLNYAMIITGAAQPQITRQSLAPTPIPLPPLPIQEQIVAELDKINEVIEDCRELLKNLDALAQSLFYDTFGDPIENEKGWEVRKLGNCISLKAGKAIKASELTSYNDSFFPCYGGNGIRGYINRHSHEGTYNIIGRQGALCGNITLAAGKFYATEHALVVSPLVNMNPLWLYHQLTIMNLNQYAKGVAQPGLSVNSLSSLPIPLPPLSLQNRFASQIEAIEERKKEVEETIKELQTLLDSRMDYWFN